MLCATSAAPASAPPRRGALASAASRSAASSRARPSRRWSLVAQKYASAPTSRSSSSLPRLQSSAARKLSWSASSAAPVHRGAEVLLPRLEPPPRRPRSARRVLVLERLGELGVVLGVAAAVLLTRAGRVEQLERVLADGLEHDPPHLAVGVEPLVDEARPDERRERRPAGAADRGGARAAATAGEPGEAREPHLLPGGEQPVAPVDRGAQRALAGRQVARPLDRQLERAR